MEDSKIEKLKLNIMYLHYIIISLFKRKSVKHHIKDELLKIFTIHKILWDINTRIRIYKREYPYHVGCYPIGNLWTFLNKGICELLSLFVTQGTWMYNGIISDINMVNDINIINEHFYEGFIEYEVLENMSVKYIVPKLWYKKRIYVLKETLKFYKANVKRLCTHRIIYIQK
jgi:hypothetical protein